MPGPVIPKPSSFPGVDRLPGPIKGLVETIFPPDSVPMPMTTVGPKAIPLDNYGDYVRKVAGEGLLDLGTGLNRLKFSPKGGFSEQSLEILRNAAENPIVGPKAMAAQLGSGMLTEASPAAGSAIRSRLQSMPNDVVTNLITALSHVFNPGK